MAADVTLAQREFVIEAPQARVWDLLAGTIIQCMPVEQIQIVNDSTFDAVLPMKFGFVTLPFRLKVTAADVDPMRSLTTLVSAKYGFFESSLSVDVSLSAVDEDRTQLACRAVQRGGNVLTRLLRRYQENFANGIFDSIRERLQDVC